MLYNRSLIIIAAIILIGAVSCSNGNKSAVLPPVTTDGPSHLALTNHSFGEGHNIMGAATVVFDPVAWTTQVIFNRTTEVHLNLSSFLNHANCPNKTCLTWHVTGYDPVKLIYTVDMVLVNPTIYKAMDMRVIFEALPYNPTNGKKWRVDNPDSFTSNWDIDANGGDWDDIDEWINPFIAYEKEDIEREFLPDPDGAGPTIYSDTEKLRMYVPAGSNKGSIDIIIDACFPNHCPEPYQIVKFRQSSDLPPQNANPTSTVLVEVIIADWQNDISDVSLYVPDITSNPDGFVQMYQWPDSGSDRWPPAINVPPSTQDEINYLKEFGAYKYGTLRKWWCNIANDNKLPVGDYMTIVSAKSVDPHPTQEFISIYNRYALKVEVGGSGGDPTKHMLIAFTSMRNGTDMDVYGYSLTTKKVYQLLSNVNSSITTDELEVAVNRAGTKLCFITNYNNAGGIQDNFDLWEYTIQWVAPGIPQEKVSLNSVSVNPLIMTWYNERMPDYSNNGNTIAYVNDEKGQFEIMTIAAGVPNRVTFNYADDESPAYNRADASGKLFYFQSSRAGGGNDEIYSFDSTTQESAFNQPTRLTFNTAFDGYPTSSALGTGALCWSSERFGDMDILYTNFSDPTVNLTPENNSVESWPSLSFDGQWIVFASDRDNGNFDIYRMTYQGGSISRITNEGMPDIDPCYGGGA